MQPDTSPLSALTFHSNDPSRLARFYTEVVGLPLAPHRHGTLPEHHEAFVNGIHFAIWKNGGDVGGPIVPVFLVRELAAAAALLAERGAPSLHKPLDLGEGKRVMTFRDPDGNAFRLIQID